MSSYAEWAATHSSDINGEGFGSDHLWHYESTPSNASYYKCARCFWPFAHAYNHEPDIFAAMRAAGVPDKCARQQMWPIRPEYASKDEAEKWMTVRKSIDQQTTRPAP
jgi:hypothetical protein